MRPGLAFGVCALLVGLVGMPSVAGASGEADCKGPARLLSASGTQALTIDWCNEGNAAPNNRVSEIRIDERKGVSVTVKHFNLLHYTLTHSVETVQVETYVALDKLWKQLFVFVGDAPMLAPGTRGSPCATIDTCMAALRYTAGNINEALTARLRAVTAPGVSATQRAELEALSKSIDFENDCGESPAGDLKCARERLTAARRAVDQQIVAGSPTFEQMTKFDGLRTDYNALLDRLTVFQNTVPLIVNGVVRQIPKHKAGTIVTVTFTPVAQTPLAVAASPFSVEYFSHSKWPLTYRTGYAYHSLKQVDVKTVRALSGQDLFSEVKSGKNTSAMAAFLGYEFWTCDRGGEPRIGAAVDLGTDFSKPGDRLYIGASLRFGKFSIGGGVMGGTITEGVGAVADSIGSALGTRELFAEVASKRAWSKYAAVTLRVF